VVAIDIKSVSDIGYQVWARRQAMKMTQAQTATYCGVGIRFISDLENGKATMEIGRILRVLSRLELVMQIQ
jgi:HTH-type transcriptional regulator/antitoxin HipB